MKCLRFARGLPLSAIKHLRIHKLVLFWPEITLPSATGLLPSCLADGLIRLPKTVFTGLTLHRTMDIHLCSGKPRYSVPTMPRGTMFANGEGYEGMEKR